MTTARASESIVLSAVTPGQSDPLTLDLLRPGVTGVLDCTVQKKGMPGWWDTPPLRENDHERSMGDGDFPSPRQFAARMVTIRGDVLTETPDALYAFRDRLAAQLGMMLNGGTLTVKGFGPSQWANVWTSGELEWDARSTHTATWQVTFKAPDPRKYGLTERSTAQVPSGTAVNLSHDGNYGAWPRVNIYDANWPNGYMVYKGSEFTRVPQALTTGMVHSVDFGTGLTRIQGQPTSGMISRARVIRLDPYSSTRVNVLPYQSSSQALVRWYWYDTWI